MSTVANAPAAITPRRRQTLVGTGLVAAAAAMYLFTQLGAYLSARRAAGSDWLADYTVPLTQPNVMMFTLILSAFTASWALWAIARDARSQSYLAAGLTIMFGLAFLNQAWFLNMSLHLPVSTLEGGYLWAVVGSHIVMTIFGVLYFAVVTFRVLGGNFSSTYPDAISGAVLFWYVTVALFSVIWISVYVMK